MPENANSLLIAWSLTLIALFGAVLYVEFNFAPPVSPSLTDAALADTAQADAALTDTRLAETGQTDLLAEERDANTGTNEDEDENVKVQTSLPENTPLDDAPSKTTPPEKAPATLQFSAPQAPETGKDTPRPDAKFTVVPVKDPDPNLIENTRNGPLPRISADGLLPAEYYSASFQTDADKPRIAILMSELGQRSSTTRRALLDLPPQVSAAFSPYSTRIEDWTKLARDNGREYLLMLPMEPLNYPQNDPGPLALFVDQTPKQNINTLEKIMGTTQGFVGLVSHMGSRFSAAAQSLRPILQEVGKRGLIFVDSRSTRHTRAARMGVTLGLSVAQNDRYLDNSLTENDIRQQLFELENRARTVGSALGMARPYALTTKMINEWAAGLEERGFQLVPVTSIIGYQPIR